MTSGENKEEGIFSLDTVSDAEFAFVLIAMIELFGEKLQDLLSEEIRKNIHELKREFKRRFGDVDLNMQKVWMCQSSDVQELVDEKLKKKTKKKKTKKKKTKKKKGGSKGKNDEENGVQTGDKDNESE